MPNKELEDLILPAAEIVPFSKERLHLQKKEFLKDVQEEIINASKAGKISTTIIPKSSSTFDVEMEMMFINKGYKIIREGHMGAIQIYWVW